MQRWTALLLAALLASSVALVVVEARAPRSAGTALADAGADGAASAGDAATRPAGDGGDALDGQADEPSQAPPGDVPAVTDAGTTLITGEPAPALKGDAPKTVVFGCVLVTYRGAQGAPPTARSKDAALELAKQLAEEARKDFKAAVGKGDRGSLENLGRIGRGFLEPAPEYVLFSLPKEGVSDPVDTPRGFWIARRIE